MLSKKYCAFIYPLTTYNKSVKSRPPLLHAQIRINGFLRVKETSWNIPWSHYHIEHFPTGLSIILFNLNTLFKHSSRKIAHPAFQHSIGWEPFLPLFVHPTSVTSPLKSTLWCSGVQDHTNQVTRNVYVVFFFFGCAERALIHCQLAIGHVFARFYSESVSQMQLIQNYLTCATCQTRWLDNRRN